MKSLEVNFTYLLIYLLSGGVITELLAHAGYEPDTVGKIAFWLVFCLFFHACGKAPITLLDEE